MKFARDFREAARNALRGRWGLAVGAGLVASLLGAGGGSLPDVGVDINIENGVVSANAELGIFSFNISEFVGEWLPVMGKFFLLAVLISVVTSIAMFVISSVIDVGYSKFNLELIDDGMPEFNNLFSYFKHWKTVTVANLLRLFYIFLWTLLFIIPGIVAGYSYSMTPYILADNPNLPASEAVAMSKEMMRGNRFRLFCLELSFIGWDLLSALLTFGIGNLWLAPYKKAAIADFYREVSDTRPVTYTYVDEGYTD